MPRAAERPTASRPGQLSTVDGEGAVPARRRLVEEAVPPSQSYSVTIAGGGLGGLTAALALRQRGLRTTVLEQAPELGEVGAGIQTAPNASRILLGLGLRNRLEQIKTE